MPDSVYEDHEDTCIALRLKRASEGEHMHCICSMRVQLTRIIAAHKRSGDIAVICADRILGKFKVEERRTPDA